MDYVVTSVSTFYSANQEKSKVLAHDVHHTRHETLTIQSLRRLSVLNNSASVGTDYQALDIRSVFMLNIDTARLRRLSVLTTRLQL